MARIGVGAPGVTQQAAAIAGAYGLLAGLWILGSDQVFTPTFSPEMQSAAAMLRAGTFILLSATLLFFLVRRSLGRLAHEHRLTLAEHQKLRSIVTSIDETILLLDREHRFVDCLYSDPAHLHIDRLRCLGRTIKEIGLPAAVSRQIEEACQGLWQGRDHIHIEYSLPETGGERWFYATASRLLNGEGKMSGVTLAIRDVTASKLSEQRLRASEQRFRTLAEDLDGIAVQGCDRHRRVTFWNKASENLYGYGKDEAIGRPIEELIFPAPVRHEAARAIDAWIAGGASIPPGELDLTSKDNRTVPVFSSHSLVNVCGTGPEIYRVDIDLKPLRQAQEQLRLSATVVESSGEAIMITDTGKRIVLVNPAFSRITGYTAEEVIGQTPRILSSGRQNSDFYRELWQTLDASGSWRGEVWNRRKNRETFPAWLELNAVRDDSGRLTHYIGIFSDISIKKATEAKLKHLAHHDPLTGLPNRILLRDRVDQALSLAIRNGSSIALLFLDLDHFKMVNDTLGHVAGDSLLRTIVARLQGCVREADTISRQGGDEFIVVLTGIREAEAVARVAQKILDAVQLPVELQGQPFTPSFSIGIALYPGDGEDFDTLLKKADTAMYHAKESGRNAYRFYADEMNVNARERMKLQNDLRRAIEGLEFVLHYQPQFEAGTGRLIGAEALIRWCQKGRMVAPDSFISVAEDCGLIVPIGEWALHEACRQAAHWRHQHGTELVVAVNLSAIQFKRGRLVDTVTAALDKSGLPPTYLELELTESILLADAEGIMETLRHLREMGVQLSVDDFGTGYSSLAYLKRFALNKLKIDQSFVRDIVIDPDDAAIVRAIVQLGRNLKLRTIAEGVETKEQLDFLRQEGCDEAQGFLLGRPLAAEEFSRCFLNAPQSCRPN